MIYILDWLLGKGNKPIRLERNKIGEENGKIKLIILTESNNIYLNRFFSTRGIHTYKVCYTIDEASNEMLQTKGSVRLVIIEQGMGDLYNVSTRDGLKNLISMCDGVYRKALVFYTKQAFKYDNRKFGEDIVCWEYFEGLARVTSTLIGLGEIYFISDDLLKELEIESKDPMETIGKKVSIEMPVEKVDSVTIIEKIIKDLYDSCSKKDEESLDIFEITGI